MTEIDGLSYFLSNRHTDGSKTVERGRDAMNTTIYQNIATRTAGDIYIGVVGPVRTGKSTFIKRFMETQVIPHIENVYRKERARDELPQSGSGRTIMTAEPKFVPEEAAQIQLEDGAAFSVRLIDVWGIWCGEPSDSLKRMRPGW